jgi:polysaccharide biosynthesis/export protein
LLPVLLVGCAPSAFLPESGPTRGEILDGAGIHLQTVGPDPKAIYALVSLGENVVTRLRSVDTEPRFVPTDAPPAQGNIGFGDIIGVTIFESDSGGLFLPREPGTRSGNYVTMPNQQVDLRGEITIPFAGPLHVVGETTEAVEQQIQESLGARALEPQAIVTIVDRRADPVSVLGEVNSAAHFALDPGGERVLGAIARAGGPKYAAYESMVTLQHNGYTQHALLSQIAQDPSEDIELQPGDTIYVSHEPRYFVVMGATASSTNLGVINRRIPFQDSRITLADALALAGSLNDSLANARGVFLYRYEAGATLSTLGTSSATPFPARVPTVYWLNLADPAGIFYANRFWMRNNDVIYVTNAPATDLSKFLSTVLAPFTGSAASVRSTVQP